MELSVVDEIARKKKENRRTPSTFRPFEIVFFHSQQPPRICSLEDKHEADRTMRRKEREIPSRKNDERKEQIEKE